MDVDLDVDVGRNKTARRQPGWAYSGLRRDVYNDERAAWERSPTVLNPLIIIQRDKLKLFCW